MKTTLLMVGKTVDKHFSALMDDYVERTKHYLSFEVEVIPDLKNNKNLSEDVQREKEGDMILKALQPGDCVVLLDENGKEMRSMEFAQYMRHKMNTLGKRLVFVIGGPYGFSEKVYQAAAEKMSLSRMTFSHQMVRLIFVEQLYRAMSILAGSPYHHE
jgi:23S rRNA (pseudouridine1915-N3)-methyltransferase